jgi:soluble lytic murein transglycosylase-like protein/predicted negative regulator of RcsB-dependent stress response
MRAKLSAAIFMFAVWSTTLYAATLETRDFFKQGYDQLQAKEYYPAIESFKVTIQNHTYPLLDYAYFYIAEAYQQSGNPSSAKLVYEMVVNYFKDSLLLPTAMYNLALVEEQLGESETSSLTLRTLITRFPANEIIPEARFLLGNVLEKRGEYEAAARVYRNLDLLHPHSDLAEKALERLDLLAKRSPLPVYEAPAATLFNLGIKYFQASQYKKAKDYFSRVTRQYPKSTLYANSVLMLGRIELRAGRLNKAVKYFNQCIALNKESKSEAMYYLALTYGYLESPRAAIKMLETLVATYPNSHSADDALNQIGRYYHQLGELDNSLKALTRLVDNYPDSDLFADTLWLIGNTYYKQGNYQAAYQTYERALKLPADKVSDRLLFWAGKSAEKVGDRDKAIAALKATINRYDHSYYGYRAREELKKFGIEVKVSSLPNVPDEIISFNDNSADTAWHERKYRELLALGLGDEAAAEADLIEEKVPKSQQPVANLAKYHAYVMKGKYIKPINFANKKIEEATVAGQIGTIDPRLWRLSYPRGYWQYVEKYAEEYRLDPMLVYAVIREESRFKTDALSRSRAHGLMQVMPGTGRLIAKDLGLNYSRRKMYTPQYNVNMGTYYLSGLIKQFNGNIPLALAGYNGGPNRVARWLKKYADFDLDEFVEDIPISETRNYVKKVMKSYYGYKRTYSGG